MTRARSCPLLAALALAALWPAAGCDVALPTGDAGADLGPIGDGPGGEPSGDTGPGPDGGDGGPPPGAELEGPSGIAVTSRYVLVTEVAPRPGSGGRLDYGEGHVTFIDRASGKRVGRVATTQKNPVEVVVDEAAGRAYVVNAGVLDATVVPARALSVGGIDILDLSGAGPPAAAMANVEIDPARSRNDAPAAAPSRLALAPDGTTALVGSGVAPHLYKVDLATASLLRGPGEPILPFGRRAADNGLTVPVITGGRVVVTDFNTDTLCVADDATPDLAGDLAGMVCGDIGLDTSQLEGPLDLIVDEAATRALVVMSVGGFVAQVDLTGERPNGTELAPLGPGAPNAITTCDGATALVINSAFNNLVRVDLSDGQVEPLTVFPTGSNPYLMALDCAAGEAFVTEFLANRVSRIDLDSGDREEL